jgi:hypothetical protein
VCDAQRVKLNPELSEAIARHAGPRWRGSSGDTMISVRFDELAMEGFDADAIRSDVLAAGGSASERDAAMSGIDGIRRSRPLTAESFVIPVEALQAD